MNTYRIFAAMTAWELAQQRHFAWNCVKLSGFMLALGFLAGRIV